MYFIDASRLMNNFSLNIYLHVHLLNLGLFATLDVCYVTLRVEHFVAFEVLMINFYYI